MRSASATYSASRRECFGARLTIRRKQRRRKSRRWRRKRRRQADRIREGWSALCPLRRRLRAESGHLRQPRLQRPPQGRRRRSRGQGEHRHLRCWVQLHPPRPLPLSLWSRSEQWSSMRSRLTSAHRPRSRNARSISRGGAQLRAKTIRFAAEAKTIEIAAGGKKNPRVKTAKDRYLVPRSRRAAPRGPRRLPPKPMSED